MGALSQWQQDLAWGKMEAYLMLSFRKLLTDETQMFLSPFQISLLYCFACALYL